MAKKVLGSFLANQRSAREKRRRRLSDQKSSRAALRLYLESVPMIELSEFDTAALAAGDALSASLRQFKTEKGRERLIRLHIKKLRGQGVKGRAKLKALKQKFQIYRELAK